MGGSRRQTMDHRQWTMVEGNNRKGIGETGCLGVGEWVWELIRRWCWNWILVGRMKIG